MIRLHGYWRSGAAWRVRIALEFKGVAYTQIAHDLRKSEQLDEAYAALNPQKLVPAIEADDLVLTQSPAILEWLEDRYPNPPLLPTAATGRARVRAMVMTVCCDIHPLNNLRVLNALRTDFAADDEAIADWTARWISDGFAAIEQMIGEHGGLFAYGDTPSLADCCLVPQVYSARRFGVSLAPFPRITAVAQHCETLPAFIRADPSHQPDAD